jgi:hypothetical protein
MARANLDEVIEFFQFNQSFQLTISLSSTQPLTEKVRRIFLGGKAQLELKADNLNCELII